MYNKTIIAFGFCDIQNNQGRGKGYQPQPSASAENPYLDLDYSPFSHLFLYYTFIKKFFAPLFVCIPSVRLHFFIR